MAEGERWDAYTRDKQPTGETLIRGKAIPEGRYHLVCEVAVQHENGDFLLMKRDPDKAAFPGWLECTAGGCALQGEDEFACIRRELFEETGLREDRFELVGTIVNDAARCLYFEFFCRTGADPASIRLQQGETVAWRWVSREELGRLYEAGDLIPVHNDLVRRVLAWENDPGKEKDV